MRKPVAAIALAGVLVVILVILMYAPSSGQAFSVNLGIEFNTHATSAWIALDKNMFTRYGVDIDRVIKFRTGLELAAAIKNSEIDVAWACLAPILKMIDMGVDIRIVAAAHYHGYGCVGRPGITSVEDLQRLGVVRAAVTGKGAQTHILLLLAEKAYGFKADVRFVKPPAILLLVENGEVDIACLPEHYLSIAASRGLKILFTSQDLWPMMPGSYLVVTGRFLRQHPKAVCRLAEINKVAIEYAVTHPLEAAEIDAKYLGVPANITEASLSRLQLTTELNVKDMQKLADLMYENGLLKHKINITKYIVDLDKLCG